MYAGNWLAMRAKWIYLNIALQFSFSLLARQYLHLLTRTEGGVFFECFFWGECNEGSICIAGYGRRVREDCVRCVDRRSRNGCGGGGGVGLRWMNAWSGGKKISLSQSVRDSQVVVLTVCFSLVFMFHLHFFCC